MSALVMRAEDGDVLGESAGRWFDSATAAERALLARLGQLDPFEIATASEDRKLDNSAGRRREGKQEDGQRQVES